MNELLLTGSGDDFSSKTIIGNDSCLNLGQNIDTAGSTPLIQIDNPDFTNKFQIDFNQNFTISAFVKIGTGGIAANIFNYGIYTHDMGSDPTGTSNVRGMSFEFRTDRIRIIKSSGFGLASGQQVIQTFQTEKWYHITVVNEGSTRAEFYINGVSIGSQGGGRNTTYLNNNTYDRAWLGVRSLTGSPFNNLGDTNYQAHTCIFNKALTDFEIFQHLYSNGGEPREPLHDSVVAHYPLAQRESYEVKSGDEALNKGVSIGDYAVWDVSERYNYAKTTPIVAQHGKLVNYAANEVGVDALQNNTSFKDFYCVPDLPRYFPVGKKYNSVDQEFDEITTWNEFDRTQPFTIIYTGEVVDTSTLKTVLGTDNDAVNTTPKITMQLDTRIVLQLAHTTTNRILFISGSVIKENESVIIIITYDGSSNISGLNVNLNGDDLTASVSVDTLTNTIINNKNLFVIGGLELVPQFSDSFVRNIEILNSDKSADTAFIDHVSKCGTAYGYVPNSEFLLAVDFSKNNGQLSTLPNTPNYTIQANKSGSNFTPVIGDGTYLETKTGLPPIVESLDVSATQAVLLNQSNLPSGDFTFFFTYHTIFPQTPTTGGRQDNLFFILQDSLRIKQIYVTHILNPSNLTTPRRFNIILDNRFAGGDFIRSRQDMANGNKYNTINCIAIARKGNEIIKWFNGINTERSSFWTLNLGTDNSDYSTGINDYQLGADGLNPVDTGTSAFQANNKFINFGQWNRCLEGWEIKELCNNQVIYSGNPFEWNNSQNDQFQDQLEIWHQFQSGSIYWDGSNYRVTNHGSGDDATLGGYTTGSADFVTDNPNSIVDINTLR